MDDALLVRGAEDGADLPRDAARFCCGEGTFSHQAVVQRPAAQQLHADQRPALVLVELEDADDPGMLERSGEGQLPAEPLAHGPIARQVRVQQLDRDLGVGGAIPRRKHLRQSARSDPAASLESPSEQHGQGTRDPQQRPPFRNSASGDATSSAGSGARAFPRDRPWHARC